MVKVSRLVRVIGREVRSLVGAAYPVDLNRICATVHHGCMRLPQELVNYIADMLWDDIQTLKACSLTCKALFASTRHLVHETLHLTRANTVRVLNRRGRTAYQKGGFYDELHFLTYASEHGLLRYARSVVIKPLLFTPDVLLPHLRHFQSMDQVHSLNIGQFDATIWGTQHRLCFIHLYPALTSLTLYHPSGRYRALMQFILQFPNLEKLCLETRAQKWFPDTTPPATTYESPPFRGHLRLAGFGAASQWPVHISFELPSEMNFRTVEYENFFGLDIRYTLNRCAGSLENLIVIPHQNGYDQLQGVDFTDLTVLRRLTLRMTLPQMTAFGTNFVVEVLSTIKSPVFRELVIEIDVSISDPTVPLRLRRWDCWKEVDNFLTNRFTRHQDFRLFVRAGKISDQQAFESHAMGAFPLLVARECFHLETSHSIRRFPH